MRWIGKFLFFHMHFTIKFVFQSLNYSRLQFRWLFIYVVSKQTGNTPLHWAVKIRDDCIIVDILIKSGAQIDSLNKVNLFFWYLYRYKYNSICCFLKLNQTPLAVAAGNLHNKVMSYLVTAGANLCNIIKVINIIVAFYC